MRGLLCFVLGSSFFSVSLLLVSVGFLGFSVVRLLVYFFCAACINEI